MTHLIVFLAAYLLDALLGDPAWLPHPVVLMGRCITALEKRLRRRFPQTPKGELWAGTVLAAALPLGTLAVSGGACLLAARLHPLLGLGLQSFWCGPNAGGYLLEADEDTWQRSHKLLLVGLPRYTKKGGSQ